MKYYDSIFDGIGFVLRSNFTIEELEESIFFIQEHLNNKFQNQILKTIFDSANNSLVITDTKGVIQYANRYFLRATGYENDEVLGGLPKLIKSGFHNEAFYQELWDIISSGTVWNGFCQPKEKWPPIL